MATHYNWGNYNNNESALQSREGNKNEPRGELHEHGRKGYSKGIESS